MNVRVGVVCLFLLGSCATASGQTAPPRDAQAALLLQQSLSALSGGVAIQDVTLTGTVQRTVGSTSESGAAILKGTAPGDSLTEFDLPSGTRSQSRQTGTAPPTGSWEGPDGTAHPIAQHNLLTDPTWFDPALLLERALTDVNYGIVYEGTGTKDNVAVNQVRVYFYPPGTPAKFAKTVEQLSQADIYLDSASGLPVALDFSTHPDDDMNTNIPVEVRFSDYVHEGAEIVPQRIQRYLQSGLLLDIHVTSAQFNTGLTAADTALP